MKDIQSSLKKLEGLHQKLKLKYLSEAQKRGYPNSGIGSEKNNQNTVDFLKNSKKSNQKFFEEYGNIQEELEKSSDPKRNYLILRKLYMISPSVHEIWFFDSHLKHKVKSFVQGRMGFKGLLTANSKKYEPTLKASTTFLTKMTLLLENQCSREDTPNLLEVEPVSDPFSGAKEVINLFETFSSDDYRKILRKNVIRKTLSTIHGILKKRDYRPLRSSKLASKDKWLYYAPCAINEGPLFLSKAETDLMNLSSEINIENPRKSVKEKLWIWDYEDEIPLISRREKINKINSKREKLVEKIRGR